MKGIAHGHPEPLQVVLDFVSAVDSGTVRLALADDCLISFLGCECRGIFAAATYLRDVATRIRHAGFKEAAEVRPGPEVIIKERFRRFFDRRRRRLYEQKERQRATTMHLRLETDDEVLPGRLPHQLVTPPRPASFDMDQLKYVEANGELRLGGTNIFDCDKVHLTLGYRQAPLSHSQERRIEICLAVYERYHMPLKRAMLQPRDGHCNVTEGAFQNGLDDQVSGERPVDGKQEQLEELEISQDSVEECQENSMNECL